MHGVHSKNSMILRFCDAGIRCSFDKVPEAIGEAGNFLDDVRDVAAVLGYGFGCAAYASLYRQIFQSLLTRVRRRAASPKEELKQRA